MTKMDKIGQPVMMIKPAMLGWLTHRSANSSVAITFVLGYFLSIASAWELTLTNFITYTLVNVLCGVVLWWLRIGGDKTRWQIALSMLALSLLAFISGLFIIVGIGFNWLLYFVVVATYFTYLSILSATIASLLLFVASQGNLFLDGGWKGVYPGWASLLAGFCFVAAFSLSNRLLSREQQRSQQLLQQLEASNRELELAHQQVQAYANEVEELATARERTRLARDIHDTLGHYLTIISIQLETISKLQERDPARVAGEIEETRRVAAQCMQEVRNAVAALRPMSIATLNVIEALTQLGNEFRAAAPDIELTLDQDTTLPLLSAELQLAFYRAAQEALTNVRKHAHATKVLLRLRYEDEIVELIIRDNGNGAVHDHGSHPGGGFGLIGLRERVKLLGGEVLYGPQESDGYRVTVRIRVAQANGDQSSSDQLERGGAV